MVNDTHTRNRSAKKLKLSNFTYCRCFHLKFHFVFLPCDAMQSRSMLSCGVCPSVCLSVRPSDTFVDHVKTNKHIFATFSPSGSHTILLFPHQTEWRYSDGNPPNIGVECKGYDKIPFFDHYFHQYLDLSQKRL